MSRRIVAALIGAVCLPALAACTATISGTGPLSSGSGTAAQVVRATQATCQFIPTAATIAGILTAQPALSTAESIAAAICKAVAPLATGPGLEGVRQGYVGRVRVRGRFAN